MGFYNVVQLMLKPEKIPLSLYIHFPWCIRKCPYCDFNSHTLNQAIPEKEYIEALLQDLDHDLSWANKRPLISIFMGGGTPSLFSASSLDYLLQEIAKRLCFAENIEITLEANPGTVEAQKFNDYKSIGINRLSLGVQSFNDTQLKKLGRIHSSDEAFAAIEVLRNAGFTNFNLDLMHGLPEQTIEAALLDLSTAITLAPPHISWYQLTIEPNTVFYKSPPPLPNEESLETIEIAGKELLTRATFENYEVSAYATNNQKSLHNLNYWQFGDYLGIGAGAHGKITHDSQIIRTQKIRHPASYLDKKRSYLAQQKIVAKNEILFEYMLNRLRVFEPITAQEFSAHTGLEAKLLQPGIAVAKAKNFIEHHADTFSLTPLGRRFLNDVTALFLPSDEIKKS